MHHVISFLLRIFYALAFGFILILHTADIIRYIPQLLGGLLMFECIAQLLELFYLKAKTQVHSSFFIIPCFITLYGLFLIFCCELPLDLNSFAESIGTLVKLKIELKLGGICFLAFVISEIVISIAFFKPIYQPQKFAEEKAKRREAQLALEREQQRQAELAAQKEKELTAQKETKTTANQTTAQSVQ